MRKSERWVEWLPEGFGIEVCLHSVKTRAEREASRWCSPQSWNTYLLFSDKLRFSKDGVLCLPYSERDPLLDKPWDDYSILKSLDGWNGGVTFDERTVDADTGLRRLKVGDDFQHLWDSEHGRWDGYDLEYIQMRVRATARELIDRMNLWAPVKESSP
jgi:hypothetical protein